MWTAPLVDGRPATVPQPATATTHVRAAPVVTLDGVVLTEKQADVALKVLVGAEFASDGSLIRTG